MKASACFIVGRNLGDAVIQSSLVARLAESGYARELIVWTRPQVAFLFERIPGCSVIVSQFPLGTTKQFGIDQVKPFLAAARAVRARRPEVTVDFIGDFRERICARLAGSRRHVHIGWAPGHPFRLVTRNPLGAGRPLITVPADVVNLYEAYDRMVDALLRDAGAVRKPTAPQRPARKPGPMRIGLHPFASQECRMWPGERWRELAGELISRGAHLSVFGAPAERETLRTFFGDEQPALRFVTESIPRFAEAVGGLDLMIGLDSFSVHMSASLQVPTIVINGGNHPKLWGPPRARVLAESGGCRNFPCYNKPTCVGSDQQYACVRATSVVTVLAAVDDLLPAPTAQRVAA